MIRVLGIDPGSRHTGYGVVDGHGNRLVHVTSGTIAVPGSLPFPERLGLIFGRIHALIRETAPDECAVEDVFMSRNAKSALILGQRAVRRWWPGSTPDFPCSNTAPCRSSKAVVGYGKADKDQVMQMVRTLLGVTGRLSSHAADALAVAVCHIHSRSSRLCRQVWEQR